MESLDYRVVADTPMRVFHKNANLRMKFAQRLIAKWFIYLMVGITTGVIAFLIKHVSITCKNGNPDLQDTVSFKILCVGPCLEVLEFRS